MKDEEQIYISAVRYALGRKTYIVGVTCDFINKQVLSKECRDVIIRDIKEAEETNNLGMETDKKEWLRLLWNLEAYKN